MSRAEFWILNAASFALAVVIVFEMYSSDQLEAAQEREQQAQLPILKEEQIQPIAGRMVERIAQGAVDDPSLKELLTKHGVKMTEVPSPRGRDTSPMTSDPPGPANP